LDFLGILLDFQGEKKNLGARSRRSARFFSHFWGLKVEFRAVIRARGRVFL